MADEQDLILINNLYEAAIAELKKTYLDPNGIVDNIKDIYVKYDSFHSALNKKLSSSCDKLLQNKDIVSEDKKIISDLTHAFQTANMVMPSQLTRSQGLRVSNINEEITHAINLISRKIQNNLFHTFDNASNQIRALVVRYADQPDVAKNLSLFDEQIIAEKMRLATQLYGSLNSIRHAITKLVSTMESYIKQINKFDASPERDALVGTLGSRWLSKIARNQQDIIESALQILSANTPSLSKSSTLFQKSMPSERTVQSAQDTPSPGKR